MIDGGLHVIELTINNKSIITKPDISVLQAALNNGIEIPHLCYHPELSISGGCRLCLVEVDGYPNPIPSCSLKCAEGMNIRTETELLSNIRKEIIDLFISEHPLNCVTCEKSGTCLLQKYAYEFDISRTSHEFSISRPLFQDDNPFFIRDHQYCILCGRCVRVCNEIVGASAIDFAGRGFECYIATPFDDPLGDSTCVFCGNCAQVCPTAALMPVSRKQKGREWELNRVKTICGYCGVGCQIEYATVEHEIIYAQSTGSAPVNGEFLCTKGRFGWDYSTSPDRLTTPLIRKDFAYQVGITNQPWTPSEKSPLKIRKPNINDDFIPIEWNAAYDIVSEKLSNIVQEFGPDSVMGLSSARCTNEDNYLFQKFFRAGIGTNNIDHCARL